MTINDILWREECRYDKYINDNMLCGFGFFFFISTRASILYSTSVLVLLDNKKSTTRSNGLTGIWVIYQVD